MQRPPSMRQVQRPFAPSTSRSSVGRWVRITARTPQETRTHLGVETQRQWLNLAIARSALSLLGLFSLITFAAASGPT